VPDTSMIRVRAVGDAKLPVPNSATARYVGRDKSGAVIPDGVNVPADSYHLRALRRGDIEEVR
jgi:hypothetical protein